MVLASIKIKFLECKETFILAVLAAVLDSSTTSNPKGGRMSQTSKQATPNQSIPNQKAPTAPPLEGTDIVEYK
ncbi:hypothetical protein TNCV_1794861 [Trichonephila clavipes]|nr:hypothetical protein TNCV_1794861 [Trichonephila clavipes]